MLLLFMKTLSVRVQKAFFLSREIILKHKKKEDPKNIFLQLKFDLGL